MEKRFIVCLIGLMLILTFVSADFEVGEPSHSLTETTYLPGVPIQGWINISLDQESSKSLFTDSVGNSIELLELIEKNPDFDYSCSTTNCVSDYSTSEGESVKTFSLETGKSTGIGLRFDEDLININSISFDVQSDALASCESQLKIDFFVDDDVEFMNSNVNEEPCALKSYGCYDLGHSSSEFVVGNAPDKHCQRIELPEAPAFKVGAWVNPNSDTRNITMSIHYLSTGEMIEGASCVLPESAGASEISCEIDYQNDKAQDYYVCIYSDQTGNSTIKGYSTSEGCAFYGYGTPPEIAAFQIFAEGKKFGDVGTIYVNNTLQFGDTLGEFAKDYLVEKYGGLNCLEGCVVPIKFTAGVDQNLILSNLDVQYETVLGPTSGGAFYDLTETTATITAEDFQILTLDDANFSVPSGYGQNTFTLELGGDEIFSESVTIGQLPMIKFLIPTKTASAYPTEFEVNVESPNSISKYKWDFGDNKTLSTPENKATHTYSTTGTYKLKVEVEDSIHQVTYKTFDITVSTPEDVINTTLKKMQTDLANVDSQIQKFSVFSKNSLDSIMNISELEEKIKQLQRDFKSAYSEQDLNDIITELLSLDIPESISVSESADSISFYPDSSVINLDILTSIEKEDNVSDEDMYKNEIILWNQENLETKVGFEKFLATYEDYDTPILNVFTINTKEIGTVKHNPYLIIRKLDDIDFKENYLENELGSYVYIELKQPNNEFTFSTTEDMDFTELPLFISPPVSRLNIDSGIVLAEEEDYTKEWIIFAIILAVIIILGFVVYVVLQEWYKWKYEGYLFKDRNDLYNIATFIHNATKKGMQEGIIAQQLRKVGWSSEQTSYAIKKYMGRRTGMIEIPIGKIFNLFKRKRVQGAPPPKMNPARLRTLREKVFKRYEKRF